MPDPLFADPRLAELYDVLDADRSDLDVYVAVVDELGAHRVLDIGCGTGTLACLLAGRGAHVIGIDPASASLDVARRKPGAGKVDWLHADASGVPPVGADLATMTGNVAQVFLDDEDWHSALRAAWKALRPGGSLAFEVRDPARRAWENWNREATFREIEVPNIGLIRTWVELTRVDVPLVSFRHVFEFEKEPARLVSDSTLRYRERDEIIASLARAGFDVVDIRDAPDRPSLEFVFITERRKPSGV